MYTLNVLGLDTLNLCVIKKLLLFAHFSSGCDFIAVAAAAAATAAAADANSCHMQSSHSHVSCFA